MVFSRDGPYPCIIRCAIVARCGQQCERLQSAAAAQSPHVASQQTVPTTQVSSPHAWLTGNVGPSSQTVWLQPAPGDVQIPQLALQQIWPTSQVFAPQATLVG